MLLNKTMMKGIIAVMLFLSVAQAEAQKGPYDLTWRFLSTNYNQPQITDSKLRDAFDEIRIKGAEIGLHRRINQRFSLGVPVSLGVAAFRPSNSEPLGRGDLFSTLDLLATFYATKSDCWLRPYLQLGPGIMRNWDAEKWAGHFPLGAGLSLRLGEGASLDFGTQFRTSSNDINGWHHNIGFKFSLGDDNVTPPPPPPPVDTDGDGIIDISDKCPEIPGIAALMGCPDADGDGIADAEDKCPTVKGIPALMGCPDSDGDGITDAEDKCPNQKGSAALMGCPDSDGDGIADSEDKCPKEAGPRSNGGCPVKEVIADRDGDGIADKDDTCPDVKGEAKWKGCPDSDGDGIGDNTDKCPKEAGPASNSGCPEIKKADQERINFAIKNIRFKTSSNVLTTESYAILDELAGILAKYPGYNVSIAGHTDSDGDAAANQKLSEGRAKSCYDYLITKGILAKRMGHAGYGETQPIADNKTAEGKQQNRRVEFNLFIP
jgi:OmpA-OmpF porin, OOP family